MKYLLFSAILCSCIFQGFSQKSPVQNHLSAGEQLLESLRLLDTTHTPVYIKIPGDSCLLFYRFRGHNWLADTKDSIEKVEEIVRDLQTSSPLFKHLRLICYSYNKDRFITVHNKPVFKHGNDYSVDYYYLDDKSSSRIVHNGKLALVNKKGKVLATSAYLVDFRYIHTAGKKRLKAKLLTEKNGEKVPLANATVYLSSDVLKDTTSSTKTNKYGDFELSIPENSKDHLINVEPGQANIKTVILASQEGVEMSRLQRTPNGFEYKLIPLDIVHLTEMQEEEDIATAFMSFLKTKEKEFKKSEYINYNVGSYVIEDESKKILDRVASILTDNPAIRLEVISHTDAQGDDHSNMELSEKRSLSVVSYLILIGVHKDRLTFTGKGETQIRNRCKNGVDCSDIEHRYNRRTEFRFVKE